MKFVKFISRRDITNLHHANPAAHFYDTSTHAPTANDYDFVHDFSEFSPFVQYGDIPVPRSSYSSDTVEGVWQGLKLVCGHIDLAYFHGKGRKRDGNVKGHLYGDRVLKYKEARKKIFIPTYTFMVKNHIPKTILEEIRQRALDDTPQFFFDVDQNGNLGNLHEPLAHSAVLVDIINEELRKLMDHGSYGNGSNIRSRWA